MISRAQAKALLSRSQPLNGHACVTDADLRAERIQEDALDSHPWYTGTDCLEDRRVHLLEREGVEAYVAGQNVRPKLSAEEAIAKLLLRDMDGDSEWRLTAAAKVELARVMQEMGPKEGRGR